MKFRVYLLVSTLLALPLAGCGEILDEMDISDEDRQDFEEAMDEMREAAEQAANDAADAQDGAGEDGGDPPPQDPDWSPEGMPPPPGEPTTSEDQSDASYCESGHECGWASYDDDDGTAANDHYEDVFGRPPDETVRRPSRNNEGEPYDAVTNTWDDGDVQVEVYTDHNGTDVIVTQATGP